MSKPIKTKDEVDLETCWYCDECYKPMAEEDDGYSRHQIGVCSEECADEHDAARYEHGGEL